jgi:hypothetical protein
MFTKSELFSNIPRIIFQKKVIPCKNEKKIEKKIILIRNRFFVSLVRSKAIQLY